jgi:hypothetical protein
MLSFRRSTVAGNGEPEREGTAGAGNDAKKKNKLNQPVK